MIPRVNIFVRSTGDIDSRVSVLRSMLYVQYIILTNVLVASWVN